MTTALPETETCTITDLHEWSEALLSVRELNSELRHRLLWEIVYGWHLN